MNPFGLHMAAFAPGADLARVEPWMDRLQEAGIGLIEVPLLDPRAMDPKRAAAFRRRYGVELFFSLALPAALDVGERPQEGLDFLEPAFRLGAEVGGMGPGGATYATPGRLSGRAATMREIDGLCRFLERAARLGRAHGQRLGLAPLNRYETHLINRAADAAAIIERVGSEDLFLHLDSFHMALEEESFAAALAAAAPHLGYLGLSESHRGMPGRGLLDWTALFRAADGIGYSGPAALACMAHAEPELARALALRRPPAAARPEELLEEGLPFLRDQAREAGVALGGG